MVESTKKMFDLFKKIQQGGAEINRNELRNIIVESNNIIKEYVKQLNSINHLTYLKINNNKGDRLKNQLTDLIKKIESELSHLTSIRDDFDKPFSIFVMGVGKMGKSSLVNALLGEEKAEENIIPKTWKIDIFQANELQEKLVTVKYRDGRKEELRLDKVKEIVKEEEKKSEASITRLNDVGKELRQKYINDPVRHKEELEKYQRIYDYISPIIEIVWSCSENPITRNFNVVDTPGLNQRLLSEEVKVSTKDYYNKADGVLWMLNATVISKKSSKEMLDELDESMNSYQSGCKKNIIGILNKIDLIDNNSQMGIQQVLDKANEIFIDKFEVIIPFSAKLAKQGIIENNMDKLAESGYVELKKTIDQLFKLNGAEIRNNSKEAGLKSYLSNITDVCKEYLSNFQDSENRYESNKKSMEKDLYNQKNDLIKDLSNLLSSYRNEVNQLITSNRDNVFNLLNNPNDFYRSENTSEFIKESVFKERMLDEILSRHILKINTKLNENYAHWYEHAQISQFKTFKINLNLSVNKVITAWTGLGNTISNSMNEILRGGFVDEILTGIQDFFGLKEAANNRKKKNLEKNLNLKLDKVISVISNNLKVQIESSINSIQKNIEIVRNESFELGYFEYIRRNDVHKYLEAIMSYKPAVRQTEQSLAEILSKMIVEEVLEEGVAEDPDTPELIGGYYTVD